VVGQTGVVDFKTKMVEHLSDEHGSGLLTIHANGKGLCSSEKEETVEWSERISSGINDECHLLTGYEKMNVKGKDETVTFARSSLLQVITPAIRS